MTHGGLLDLLTALRVVGLQVMWITCATLLTFRVSVVLFFVRVTRLWTDGSSRST